MNPLLDVWLALWNRLVGRRYGRRHRPEWERRYNLLDASVHQLRWQLLLGAFARNYGDGEQFAIIADMLRRGSISPYFHYRHFTKPKKDGTVRALVEPDAKLKAIQHTILKQYLQSADVHPAAKGFRRKKSIADHAWAHAGADYIITADIQDFFPATRAERIQEWWQGRFPGSEQAAQLMTVLTTYRGALPQGAPTSPALSNVVNVPLDRRLDQQTQRSGGTYTRYCDDMVFSWRTGARPPADFAAAVRAIMREYGYTLHPSKGWVEHARRDEPAITGVILARNGAVRLPAALRDQMHTLANSDDPQAAQRLAGYRAFQQMIETPRAPANPTAPRTTNKAARFASVQAVAKFDNAADDDDDDAD